MSIYAGKADLAVAPPDFRVWHKADAVGNPSDVCFRGQSGHDLSSAECLQMTDSVAKVVLPKVLKILRAVGGVFV